MPCTPNRHKGVQAIPGAWGRGHYQQLDEEVRHCTFFYLHIGMIHLLNLIFKKEFNEIITILLQQLLQQ